jgi:hypothetical protein
MNNQYSNKKIKKKYFVKFKYLREHMAFARYSLLVAEFLRDNLHMPFEFLRFDKLIAKNRENNINKSKLFKDLNAVCVDGLALRNIKVQTPEIALAAVSQNGLALAFVDEQSPELALAAVNQNGWAISDVKNQSSDIILAAVSQNGYVIHEIKERTEEIMQAAFNQIGNDLLNFSARNGLGDVVDFLISKNVPVDHVSERYPDTPFQMTALTFGKKDILLKLFEHGADIHIKNEYEEQNILSEIMVDYHVMLRDSVLRTISILLEIGVSPTDVDREGNTAMTHAIDAPEILNIFKSSELKKTIHSSISILKQPVTSERKVF